MVVSTGVDIRTRCAADVPELVRLLGDQQPETGYPLTWPMPTPVAEFLIRPGEECAWVAERDGAVIGHAAVCRPGRSLLPVFVDALGTNRVAEITAPFVAYHVTGTGVGGRLLDTAVESIETSGRIPVLDVVGRGRPFEIYRRRGWKVIGETRPDWLPEGRGPLVLMALRR